MILRIDVNYSLDLESKLLAEIKKEFNVIKDKVLDEPSLGLYQCPSVRNIIISTCSEFALQLCKKIYSNL